MWAVISEVERPSEAATIRRIPLPHSHQAQVLEGTPDHAVTEAGQTVADLINGQPWQQDARVLDLHPVVEHRQADRGSALGVVGMDHRVHQRFAKGHRRN